ncbi:EpsG family protein [Limosilactobacillus mucosae]
MGVYLALFLIIIMTYPVIKYNKNLYLIINSICIFIVMALRSSSVGADTIPYKNFFESTNLQNLPSNFINWLAPLQGQRFETGFMLYNKILYSISSNFQCELIITSLLIITCYVFFLVRLEINYFWGFLTYLSLGFFANSMNLMRQSIAWALLLVAFVYCIEKKPFKFLLFVMLAAGMHVTAWLFLVVYPLSFMNINIKNVSLIFGSSFIITFTFEKLYGFVSNYSTEASSFSEDIISNQLNGGVNLAINILLFTLIFLIGVNICLDKTLRLNDKTKRIVKTSLYMLISAIAVSIVSFKFSQLSRIAMYFATGEIILIPFIIENIRNYRLKRIISGIVTIGLIAYFIVIQVLRPEWSNIVPYHWFNY